MSALYDPATRLLTILHILHTGGIVTAELLANKIEVSPRTVRRYITMLRDLGILVEVQLGAGGGYYLASKQALPPSIFSHRDLQILLLALSRGNLTEIDERELIAIRDKLLALLKT